MKEERSQNRIARKQGQMLLREVAAYQRPSRWRSIWQLANTLVPFAVLWYLGYEAFTHSVWLALPVAVLLAGFLVRTFIIFHDCGHGSFFRSKRANDFWGRVTGLLTFTPYSRWRASHARHHGTSGNLDKRGEGDVWMMTLQEYLQAGRWERAKYRLYRNPLVMLLFGPLLITLVNNRFVGKGENRRDRRSVLTTNAGLAALVTGMVFLVGWQAFLFILLVPLFIAHVAGVWLFYIQHQFEGVYWERNSEWDFVTAALKGGSFYDLPAILQWFTGSIGYHHVHHLNPRIPNYNLARCQEEIEVLQCAKKVRLFPSFGCLRFRLWDEDSGRLIGFGDIKALRPAEEPAGLGPR
jgi:omega-6 fatty acid desaturase (delta-12 desaturase)